MKRSVPAWSGRRSSLAGAEIARRSGGFLRGWRSLSASFRLYRAAAIVLFLATPAWAGVAEAIRYLEDEVPRWKRENNCYSCHNDGDGARALLVARRRTAVEGSLRWLEDPDKWDDKPLARVQFASALAAAGSPVLARVAERVSRDQLADGHWKVDEETGPGSPATYGPVLGTYLARRVLEQSGSSAYRDAIARANAWMEVRAVSHPLDVSARVLALGRRGDIDRLIGMQAGNGSWNSEPFDTAIAILALKTESRAAAAVERARKYLLQTQLEPGGWPGTTRPAGGASYAQHISTTAWCLLALLE